MEITLQRATSVVLSTMFIIAGSMKYPIIQSSYDNLKKNMEVYVTVFPGLLFGSPVNAVSYMYVAGTIELLCGLGLLLGSPRVKVTCSGALICIMVIGLYTMVKLGHYSDCLPLFVLLISFCWLCYSYLDNRIKKNN